MNNNTIIKSWIKGHLPHGTHFLWRDKITGEWSIDFNASKSRSYVSIFNNWMLVDVQTFGLCKETNDRRMERESTVREYLEQNTI